MNGLKYIRTRCNYSQRALAEAIGVSRQSINMWENAIKFPSKEHKEDLCAFFGLEDAEAFGTLTPEQYEALQARPVYKRVTEDDSERFSFRCGDAPDHSYKIGHPPFFDAEELSLDDKCTLARAELKSVMGEFAEYAAVVSKKNSLDNLFGTNRVLGVLVPVLDLLKESNRKRPGFCMIYYKTLLAVLDAMGISFGTVEKEAVLNRAVEPILNADWYDYREFSAELAEAISGHLDRICALIPQKAKNPHENFRRRPPKTKP